MKDEIKEINIPNNILATLGDLANGALNYYKAPKTIELKYKLLLDYITNLQEELEIMVKDDERSQETIIKLSKENERLSVELNKNMIERNNYKSRNEKAIEYIEERKNLNWYADGVFVYELLNILQGEDKDE